ncbi:MAG: hypothetical protein ACYS0H_25630 [Planctomycetota bacterium]|jgi:hypothetical protein
MATRSEQCPHCGWIGHHDKPAVEGGEKTALQAFDDMCDLYKARIRELEATLRSYICNECDGDPDCTDATTGG